MADSLNTSSIKLNFSVLINIPKHFLLLAVYFFCCFLKNKPPQTFAKNLIISI